METITCEELDRLERLAKAASPGPWQWELNEESRRVKLVGGSPKFDCTVMDFVRYGFNGAMPRFVTEVRPRMNLLEKCTEFAKTVKGREHHANWFKTIDNQDANFIADTDPGTVLKLIDDVRASRWQPIESFPNDPELSVDLLFGDKSRETDCDYSNGFWMKNGFMITGNPTHWKLPPNLPEGE